MYRRSGLISWLLTFLTAAKVWEGPDPPLRAPRAMPRLLAAAAILLLGGGIATAEDLAVPVETQVPLFLKILTFDRNLPSRAGDDVTIAIVYQRRFRDSLLVREAFVAAIAAHPHAVGNLPVRCVDVDLDETPDLAAALRRVSADVVYVAPLRSVAVTSIARATRALRVLSITGVADYVRGGLAIGIDERRGRPRILVNREAERKEGVALSSQLLKLATLVGGRHGR